MERALTQDHSNELIGITVTVGLRRQCTQSGWLEAQKEGGRHIPVALTMPAAWLTLTP